MRFGAKLLLAHVVAALPKLPPGVSIFKEGEYERRLHEDAVRRVGDMAATQTKGGLSVRSEVGIANDVGILESPSRNIVVSVFTAHHYGTGAYLEDAIARVAEQVADYFAYR